MLNRVQSWLLACCIPLAAFSQLPGRLCFQQLGVEQGLLQSTNFFIYRDSKDYIWISSGSGVNRFDGRNVKTYQSDTKNPQRSLFGQIVQSPFWEDRQGNIWLSTFEGVNCYVRQWDHFQHYTLENTSNTLSGGYFAMWLDREDKLWVIAGNRLHWLDTRTRQFEPHSRPLQIKNPQRLFPFVNGQGKLAYVLVISLNEPGLEIIRCDAKGRLAPMSQVMLMTPPPSFSTGFRIIDAYIESENKVWLATTEGLCQFDPATGDIVRCLLGQEDNLIITAVEPYGTDFLLLTGTSAGLMLFEKRTKKVIRRYQHLDADPYSLPANNTHNVYLDPAGVIWVSVPGYGVAYADPAKLKFSRQLFAPEFPAMDKNFRTSAIAEDQAGNIWCGSIESGIAVFLRRERCWKFFSAGTHGLPEGNISKIFVDAAGSVWVLHWNGLFQYDKARDVFAPINNTRYYFALQLRDGRTLFASRSAGIQQITEGGSRLKFKRINAIDTTINFTWLHETIDGVLIGNANGAEMHIFDIRQNFRRIAVPSPVKGIINGIVELPGGQKLWVATNNGLVLLDKRTWQADRVFTEQDGLPSRNIQGLLLDRQQRLWLSTEGGIAQFDINDRRQPFQKFTMEDGLSAIEHTPRSYLLDSKGQIWFGSVNGITTFNPNDIRSIKNQAVPRLSYIGCRNMPPDAIVCHQTGATNVGEIRRLECAHNQNSFTFTFAPFEYSAPALTQFQFKMEGSPGAKWTNPSSDNTARYADLPSGKYTFWVKAANSDGEWNESQLTQLQIIIHPPWWNTWWANVLKILLGALTVATLIYYLYMYPALKIMEVRERMTSDLHDDVSSALTAIRLTAELALQKENGSEAVQILSKITHISRDASKKISDIIWANKLENDTFEDVLLRIRTDARLILNDTIHLNLSANPALHGERISGEKRYHLYLIFKEALTNAAKYSNASQIYVKLSKDRNELHLEIKDDGRGFDLEQIRQVANTGGNGLSNMQHRAHKLAGELKITTAPGQGTQVYLKFPLHSKQRTTWRQEWTRIRRVIRRRL